MRGFAIDAIYFKDYHISELYGMIARRNEGGGDLIKHPCTMLTTAGMKKREGHGNRVKVFTDKQKKRDTLNWIDPTAFQTGSRGRALSENAQWRGCTDVCRRNE